MKPILGVKLQYNFLAEPDEFKRCTNVYEACKDLKIFPKLFPGSKWSMMESSKKRGMVTKVYLTDLTSLRDKFCNSSFKDEQRQAHKDAVAKHQADNWPKMSVDWWVKLYSGSSRQKQNWIG